VRDGGTLQIGIGQVGDALTSLPAGVGNLTAGPAFGRWHHVRTAALAVPSTTAAAATSNAVSSSTAVATAAPTASAAAVSGGS